MNSIRQNDQKSQDVSGNIFSDAFTSQTNDLYHRLTALIRGEEVNVANDAEVDHEPTYIDAEQVRAENDGADFVRNFENLTPEERDAETRQMQAEIDEVMDLIIRTKINRF